MTDKTNTILWTAFFAVVVLGYMYWLNSGCQEGGAMTRVGKICIETLFENQ